MLVLLIIFMVAAPLSTV
ncbi:hypothetical protein ABTE23_21915, partial [Acinetobacter baumannii]